MIRCATLNVWALPAPFGRAVDARLRAIARELPQIEADIVAFQEVWTDRARRKLERAGVESGLPHAWSSERAFGGGGLLLLSRWPLHDPSHTRYSLPHLPSRPDHPDYYVSKGYIGVEVATPSGPLHVATTHLQARYGRDVDHEYRAERVGQVVELAMGIEPVRTPIVVLGDFNFRERHDEYRVLTGLSHLRDAAVEADSRAPTVDAANPFRKRGQSAKRIDYAFVRDGDARGLHVAALRRAFDHVFTMDGRDATFSDHAGLIVDLVPHAAPLPRPAPDTAAARLATAILAEGRDRAERAKRDALAGGAGVAAALGIALGSRNAVLSRRRLLRGALLAAAAATFAPGVVYTMRSQVYAPDAVEAYERLTRRLAGVADPGPQRIA